MEKAQVHLVNSVKEDRKNLFQKQIESDIPLPLHQLPLRSLLFYHLIFNFLDPDLTQI